MGKFEELQRIEKWQNISHPLIRFKKLGESVYPIYALEMGPDDASLPTLGIFAGVHGLERVGVHVALHYIESLLESLKWDKELEARLHKMRFLSIPMINPWGVYNFRRSNPDGIDLMRNAPVVSKENVPLILGGHQISNKIPWYQGKDLAKENQILIQYIQENFYLSPVSFALDLHSGFGLKDRLWYPYASTKRDFVHLHEVKKVIHAFEKYQPHHIYKIEPQSDSYLTHGDVWDYLSFENKNQNLFVPWCLEMGSWQWIRKNPLQALQPFGIFNPIKPHRYKRIMRRHYPLLDFFFKVILNYKEVLK